MRLELKDVLHEGAKRAGWVRRDLIVEFGEQGNFAGVATLRIVMERNSYEAHLGHEEIAVLASTLDGIARALEADRSHTLSCFS